jgi:ssDNA-binding Zn-finger/Zn-ribbon topoisomerase 1
MSYHDDEFYREQHYRGNYERPCGRCGVKDSVENMHEVDAHRQKQIALADAGCRVCDGVMMVRVTYKRARRHLFLGCSNFPRCRHSEGYKGKWYKEGELVVIENRDSPDFYCERCWPRV